jgi:hypothetical protein
MRLPIKPPAGISPVKPRKGKPTPKLGIPGKPKVGTVKEPVMDVGYRPDIEGMKKGIATSKKKMMGMAYGGMTKKGMNKGGMANCGASMKPAQGK